MSNELAMALKVGGIAVGFPLVAWAFGSAVLARFTRLDREERFAASFGVGFAALGLCAFLAFVLHAPQPHFNAGAVAFLLGVALLCHLTREKRPPGDTALRLLVVVFVLAYLHLVCIQALLPAYRGSYWYYDWWMHYDEALVFVGDQDVTKSWANGYTVASRTPLFNLTAAFVMGLAGHDFDTYQLASALTNIAFVLAAYLLLRDLFGRRAAWLALLLAPLNLWMLHNAWFTWPKMLAAYYLILALHFYLQSLRLRRADPVRSADYFFGFWAAAVLGYMTHQVALVYVVPLLLHAAFLAIRERTFRPLQWLACVLMAVAVVGPWYAWLAGTLGRDKITGSTPITLGDESARFKPLAIARWMSFDLSVSVIPVGIGQAFVTGLPPDAERPPWSVEVYQGGQRWYLGPPNLVELHRGVTQLYFSLLTGAITVSVSLFLIVAAVRRWRSRRVDVLTLPATKEEANGRVVWSAVWLFLAVGTLGAAFLHPGLIAWGIAHSAAFPSALVLAALAWGLLARAGRGAVALVCCGMVLEFLLMFWSHWWLLFHNQDVLDPRSSEDGLRPGVRMLNECLGGADVGFLVGAVVVQAILIVLLFMTLRRAPAPAAEGTK